MRRTIRIIPSLILPLVLAGCFTISDGDSRNISNPVSFAGFDSIKSPGKTKIGGLGQEATYARDGSGVTSVDEGGPASVTVDISVTGEGDTESISELTINGPKTISSWKMEPAEQDDLVISSKSGNAAVYALPLDAGFDYQTFGIWQTGIGTASGTAGAYAVGAQTAGVDIPVTEGQPVSFVGYTLGNYVGKDGKEYVTSSASLLQADFSNRSVNFQSDYTNATNIATGETLPAPGLDLNGNMTYGENSNVLSGSVVSANGMSGTVNGRFFGPSAEEIGGIFSLEGSGPESFGGSFGAKSN